MKQITYSQPDQSPLFRPILRFSIPLMLTGLLQLAYNTADSVVVGRYAGSTSLAAVGATTSIIFLLVTLFNGVSIGTNYLTARYYGAGDQEAISQTVHCSAVLSVILGLMAGVVGILFSTPLLELAGAPMDVLPLSSLYLKIYFLGIPALVAYNFGSAILRAKGDTQRPLYFLLAAGVLNVVLNLFFVIVCRLDVAGVAMATSISQYVSAWLILRCLMREHGALHLNLHRMHLNKRVIGRIFQVGLPAGFQGVIFSLSNVVIQSSINSFGDTVMAGSAAAQNIEGFVYAAMNAFYQSALTFSGQNYGAGKCDRVDKVALYCQGFVILTGLILGNLAFFFGSQLLGIYAPGEPDVIQQGLVRMSYIGRLYAICGIMDTMVGILRGIGYSIVPMVVSLLGSCVLRLLWVWFVFPLDPVPGNLYISYPITWAITGAVHIIMFLAIRKKAYAKVQGSGPSYLSVDGHHPEATEQ